MSAGDLLGRLVAAGVPADLIGEVAMALARGEAAIEAIGKRRSSDRDRKAKSRDITGQHVTSRDAADTPAPSPPSPSFPQTPNKPLPPHPHPDCEIPRTRKADPFPMPDWADAQAWKDFLANRAKKRLPNTPSAHKRFLSDIARLTDEEWPPGRLLQHAAERGWCGIYDPRDEEQRNGRRNGRRSADDDSPHGPSTRAAIGFLEDLDRSDAGHA